MSTLWPSRGRGLRFEVLVADSGAMTPAHAVPSLLTDDNAVSWRRIDNFRFRVKHSQHSVDLISDRRKP